MVNNNGKDHGEMKKILALFILAILSTIPAQAYTRSDLEAIYQNEPDLNIREMGVRQLELELGINTGYDKRTIGHFTRSNCDYATMTSLISTKRQTMSEKTGSDFTMHLSNENIYDEAYYKEREKDLDLLMMQVNYIKSVTQGMEDTEKAIFIHDYLVNSFQYGNDSTTGSAVQGFKTGYTKCLGYTAAFYIIGLNCGLKVKAVPAVISNLGLHTFNVVTINGQELAVDVTTDDSSNSRRCLLIPLPEYISTVNAVIYRDSLFDNIAV